MFERRPADPRNVPNPRRGGGAAALALGAALVLGAAGEAAAQGVCAGALPTAPNSNVGGVRIVCQESNPSASGIRINAESVSLSVTSSNFSFRPAISARLNSASDENDVNVRLGRGLVITTSAVRNAFIGVYARNAGSGATTVVMEDGASITTTGRQADGIRFSNPTAATGASDVRMTGGSITTSGTDAHGIHILHNGSGASTIDMSGGAIKASGSLSSGIYVDKQAGSGDATITFSGGSIEKSGGDGAGIGFYGNPAANAANARIRVTGGSIAVEGISNTHGVYVDHRGAGGGDVAMTGGSITTKGGNSHGVFAFLRNAANEAPVVIGMAGGSITTEGQTALGLYGIHFGLGSVTVTMEGEAEIATSGDGAHGVSAFLGKSDNEAAIVVGMVGGSVATEGPGAAGLNGFHEGLGSVTVTTGGEAGIESPFFVGVRGWLTNNANAAGRLVVTHGGAVGAGDAGVLAWAARRSGHTSGDGAEEADDAARTEPMIHVTSSGDVTVGAQVADAFIRNRIAGDDGTLSAGERAVLDAITADDSDALTTALEALPADYDDDWKAEAENLRRKRAVLTDDETLANRAAGKILGLTRAGVRALALSHETITGHVRFGDGDNALSPAERTVLAAALTGDGLETALAALPAAYTDAWKDTLRAHAASYNAGDIQVDVTGGTIAAEGDGVDARYALAHDRNGAIAVSVADGAEINGGRHGVHVGGAGLDDDGLRDQTVTVNGEVMGGTGAGVHLAGGGTVTVGRTGRVGAASGDAVRSGGAGDLTLEVMAGGVVTGAVVGNEAGDLSVTVAGRMESDDLRAPTGGELTLNVMEGGVVTGTVHDPAGPLTVRGSIGRLLYSNGGTVTVAAGGTVTGIKGESEAIRSVAGDLSVTVAGRVESDDLRAPTGGELTVDVKEGGAVTGTVHDPAGPLTVAGSIGRLLYGNGGAVTVAATGRLTGVEGEALRSAAGDLDVTVAGTVAGDVRGLGDGDLAAMVSGTVTGDLVEEGDGDLRATISGMVEGNVFGRGAGEHTVTVSDGGTVTGVIHLSASTVRVDGAAGQVRFDEGGAVTVGGTGRITGIEGVAVRNAAGALSVTLHERAGETRRQAVRRIDGKIRNDPKGSLEFCYAPAGGGERCASGPAPSVPLGASDLALRDEGGGAYGLKYDYAPRARVYEALPSVLLGLNGPSEFRARTEAPRSPNGVWARVEASGGSREAERSTSTLASGGRLSWTERRYGVETGVDFPLEANGVAGLSAHHRRGSAEVSGKDGGIEVSGTGLGASVAWGLADGVYVDGRTSATWYEARLTSGPRGTLKSNAGGFGHAVGVEAGRRVALGSGPLGELTLTPRARVVYSRVAMDDFTDVVGARVSLDEGHAATGLAGVRVEASDAGGNRVFGSVDVERAFSRETRVTVSGAGSSEALSSYGEAVRVRLEFGGAVEWGSGRYALEGAARYATGARDYGGGVNVKVRF